MDSNDKNIFRVDPLPPSNLSGLVMYCPGVRLCSVRVSSAGILGEAVKIRTLSVADW